MINSENLIDFLAENVELPKLDFNKVREWIVDVARRHNYKVGELVYCFCDDDYILKTNREFLNHDYYTDIITFDYTHDDVIAGDIVISLDTVASNANDYGQDYTRELLRVIIHGVLHLCGIDDKAPGEREIMEQNEDQALSLWFN